MPPVSTCSTGGAPISAQPRANSHALSGVTSDGFTKTAAPAISAANASKHGLSKGRFHGVMMPTTG